MPIRKFSLKTGEFYHIYNRSIENYRIFNRKLPCERFVHSLHICKFKQSRNLYLSKYFALPQTKKAELLHSFEQNDERHVEIIAFCLMPTHYHLILEQRADKGIQQFMHRVINSFSHFYNTLNERSGPLWSGRFKNIHIASDDYFMRLSRYIHRNPIKARLVQQANDWIYSSYNQYIAQERNATTLCKFNHILSINAENYASFVHNEDVYEDDLPLLEEMALD